MIRPEKVRTIAAFEFSGVVRKASFLMVTFGLPLFFVVVGGALGMVQGRFLLDRIDEVSVAGLVDHSGVLRDQPIWGEVGELEADERLAIRSSSLSEGRMLGLESTVLRLFEDEAAALDVLADGRLSGGLYVLPRDYLTRGEVDMYSAEGGPIASARRAVVEPSLKALLRDRLLRGRVDDATRERVLEPMTAIRTVVTGSGIQRSDDQRTLEMALRMAVPLFLGVFLLTALLFSSGYLVQTVALDKESKVVEVLLSSADPDELLLGKLLGLGGAGLLQFFVWAGMVILGAVAATTVMSALDVQVPWEALAFAPLFFVLGYLFIGSLMLATGSLGSSIAEAQKLTMGWAVLAIAPLFVLVVLIEEPHGAAGHILSVIPFSAPLTLMVRLAVEPDGVASWDLGLAVASMLLATWLSVRIGARLFRVGLLLGGSRPTFREVLRQARLLD